MPVVPLSEAVSRPLVRPAPASEHFDAIVIGGGPAGSTCAYHLAARGRAVLLLERECHPRFRVGESVMPYASGLLDAMGLLDEVEDQFVVKRSVETSDSVGGYFRTYFAKLAEGQKKFGFNVERSRFDALLCSHAEGAGATVVEGAEVSGLVFDGARLAGVVYERDGERHEARARFVADASGRAGLVARHFKLRRMNRRIKKVALFQYFEDVVKGVNAADEGDLVIATHEAGWIWCIPVDPNTRSVGAVMAPEELAGADRRQVFDQHLSRAPRIAAALEGATPWFDDLKVESDFCYHSEHLVGPGWFLVGDAGCFVDPVFSGGVFLGMAAACKAAEVMGDILDGRAEDEAIAHFEDFCKTGYDHYFRLVYVFYEQCNGNVECMFRQLFEGRFKPLLQILAGDCWGDENNPIWSELRSDPRWDTFERPFNRVYGCPVYPPPPLAPADVMAGERP